jgi:hypothetical protein
MMDQGQQQHFDCVYTPTFTPFDRLRLLCMVGGTEKEIEKVVAHGAVIGNRDIHGILLTTICVHYGSEETLRVLVKLGAPLEVV